MERSCLLWLVFLAAAAGAAKKGKGGKKDAEVDDDEFRADTDEEDVSVI